jgi:mortality factor 4-like protein 1
MILDTYFDEEKGKRRLGSAEADLLEEVVVGAKEYFERSLGKLLLYRFERQQYSELHQSWQASGEKTGPGDVYGAEHLVRMIGQYFLTVFHPFPSSPTDESSQQSKCLK